MNMSVVDALQRCFADKRVVFWYDDGGKCRDEFEEIAMDGIEKLIINRNEFGIKYRVLIENPEGKFLIYSPCAQPLPANDWLYDLYLSGVAFNTDPISLVVSEMNFPDDARNVITEAMLPFFRSEQRKDDVKSLLSSLGRIPTREDIELALIASVCKIRDHLKIENILKALLKEYSENKSDKIDELAKFGLEAALWSRLGIDYGYKNSTSPSIVDFVNKLFMDAFYPAIKDEQYSLLPTALSFFNDWKNGLKTMAIFKAISAEIATKLNVAQDINTATIDVFGRLDVFREIDCHIIKVLVNKAEQGSIRVDDAVRLIDLRKDGCFWGDFSNSYLACESAIRFFTLLSTIDISSIDAVDAINKYVGSWYQVDQQYRLFIEYYNEAKKADDSVIELFKTLKNKVDGFYVNNYLMKQSVSFQGHLNGLSKWSFIGHNSQQNFWNDWIVNANVSTCVIISDAFRYEIGKEFASEMEATHRYLAKITPMVSMLPSYTQLGMAALLPHNEIGFAVTKDGMPSEWVYVDKNVTSGLEYRKSILESQQNISATAINYKDVMSMDRAACRKWQSSAKILYVYHDAIDNCGDKRDSEDETFSATRRAIDEIKKLIIKVGGDYRIAKFIITADHGFLYQDLELDQSLYVADEDAVINASVRKNRFAVGTNLSQSNVLSNYTSAQLGLEGNADIRIAKGIMRMRRQGSGVKFVHGGASLQEIIVPVVEIQHVRNNKANVCPVGAEILIDGSGRITTNRFSVSVYQESAVGEEFSKRFVRLSLRSQSGELLSDEIPIVLDSEANTPQDRTKTVTLTLNHAANALKSGNVVLKMESGKERGNGLIDYDIYKERVMSLKLTFDNFF